MSGSTSGGKIDLIESSPADLPPVGTTRIIRVGGVTEQSVDGAPFAPIGGLTTVSDKTLLGNISGAPATPVGLTPAQVQALIGVPANWYASVLAKIASLQPTINNPLWTAEMTPNPGAPEVEFSAGAGSATASLLTTIDGGVANLQTGATAGSHIEIRNKNGLAPPAPTAQTFCTNMRTSKYAICTRGIVVQETAPTGSLFMGGMGDEVTDYVTLGIITASSTTNWVAKVFASLTVTTVAFDLNYHDFLLIADGTNVTFYLGDGTGGNFTQVAQIAQSNAGTNPGHWVAQVFNGASGGGQVMHIDKAMAVGVNAAT